MKQFIPREKLSKKSRKELDRKQRQTWCAINPVTRKTENAKAYNRKKVQKGNFDDFPFEPFMLFTVPRVFFRSSVLFKPFDIIFEQDYY